MAAHAPSTIYSYAQLFQVGASIDVLRNGNWLMPRIQTGGLYRKPQMYPWLGAAALGAVGVYDDFVFKLPTILAAAGTVLLVYLLGVRWYGRCTGLLAGALWATVLQMSKVAYVATTDMLLTLALTASVFCADRLVFHPPRRSRRWAWAVGLWGSVAFGALAKGWGLVNVPILGCMLALAAACRPGFRALSVVPGATKLLLAVRLVGRRWRRLAGATGLAWGLPAAALVVAAVVGPSAMNEQWRREVFIPEFWHRFTGQGAHAAAASPVPAALHMLYYALPASVFALGALFLAGPRKWLSRRGPLSLPLCWIIAVVVPFSLSQRSRPDYLLPCYAGVALMGAWAVEEVRRRGAAGGSQAGALRHVFAGVAIAIGLTVIAGAAIYGARGFMPAIIRRQVEMPRFVRTECIYGLRVAGVGGAVLIAFAVWASLTWRIRALAAAACAGMLGVTFVSTHFVSPRARTGDGEVMRRFSLRARQAVGDDGVAVFLADKLTVELYLGRFGRRIPPGTRAVEQVNESSDRWLVTCDRGLAELGAARHDVSGAFRFKSNLGRFSLATMPEEIGHVRLSSEPVRSQGWGRLHLIEIRRPVRPSGTPISTGYVSGRQRAD